MQLLSLNIWGGKRYQDLISFILKYRDTDIFCFQEVFSTTSNTIEDSGYRTNIYQELEKLLPNHKGYFAGTFSNYITGNLKSEFVTYQLTSGLAIFVNKNIEIDVRSDFFVYREKGTFIPGDLNSIPRNLQYISFTKDNQKYTVANVHGLFVKGGKFDTESRITQSNIISNFLEKQNGKKILCGDFNLDINTQSIKMLEKNMVNLIKKYNIQTTRSQYFPGKDKFADYMFVSQDMEVKNFEVPNVDCSDHLPMILEFE